METQDGGDPKVDVSPRDIVYAEEAGTGTEPQIIAKTDLRFGYSIFSVFDILFLQLLISSFPKLTFFIWLFAFFDRMAKVLIGDVCYSC